MSHFTVLVVGEDIEHELAPYQENNMGTCPREFMEFTDQEDEFQEEYETGTQTMIRSWTKLYSLYDERFQNPAYNPFSGEPGERYVYPPGSEKVEVAFKETYPTFEKFCRDYHGHKKRDPDKGRYGYWENPQARWDWYQVGGRWAGHWRIKPEFQSEYADQVPNFSHGWDAESIKAVSGQCRVDTALKKHIDFAAMRAEAEKGAGETWDKVHEVIKDLPSIVPWPEVREIKFPSDIEAARKFYNAQPAIAAITQWNQKNDYPLGVFYEMELLMQPREVYVKDAGDCAAVTHAVLKNRQWAEQGNMGWWGCVRDEKDPQTWGAIFQKFIDSLADDDRLTVVDCHI